MPTTAELNERMLVIENQIPDLIARLGALEGKIVVVVALENRLVVVEQGLAGLKGLEERLASLEQGLAGLKGLEERLAVVPTVQDVQAVRDQVTRLDEREENRAQGERAQLLDLQTRILTQQERLVELVTAALDKSQAAQLPAPQILQPMVGIQHPNQPPMIPPTPILSPVPQTGFIQTNAAPQQGQQAQPQVTVQQPLSLPANPQGMVQVGQGGFQQQFPTVSPNAHSQNIPLPPR